MPSKVHVTNCLLFCRAKLAAWSWLYKGLGSPLAVHSIASSYCPALFRTLA